MKVTPVLLQFKTIQHLPTSGQQVQWKRVCRPEKSRLGCAPDLVRIADWEPGSTSNSVQEPSLVRARYDCQQVRQCGDARTDAGHHRCAFRSKGKSPKRGTTHACNAPSRKTLGGDPTPAAVDTSSSKGWQATFTRSGLSHRYSVRAAQRDSLGDAAAGTGLRLRHDLLAKATRLATVGHLATDPFRFAGLAGTLRKDRLVPSNSR